MMTAELKNQFSIRGGKEEFSVIGRRLPRIDGVPKVTGDTRFTGDLQLPKMLWGKVLLSHLPHALIKDIDVSKARRLVGVKAVITGKDTPGKKDGLFDLPHIPADQQYICVDKVRYIGDGVAAVAAVDEDTAMEALELIKVDYEELPAVFDPLKALEEGAPQIHDHAKRNICCKMAYDVEDVEKAFEESDHIREDRFISQGTQHSTLEPHSVLASYEQGGTYTVWASTQSPYMTLKGLAKTLDVAETKIRVINPPVGGGFGSKGEMQSYFFSAAMLSKVTGVPVRINCTREEVYLCTRQRHPMIMDLKTGVKKDGQLTATQCKIVADGGAYASTSFIALYLAGAILVATYKLPSVRFEGVVAYTNKSIRGPQRGHGGIQPRYAADVQLELIAKDLGIDPVEIRLKNALKDGDRLPNKHLIQACGLRECIEKTAKKAGWQEKKGKLAHFRGIGIGCSAFISGMWIPPYNTSGAFVKLNRDGGAVVFTGASEIGQGSDSALASIAAEELGLRLEDIKVISGDTATTPMHAGSYSSRVTLWAGNAVRLAAAEARRQLLEVAAESLEARLDDLECKEGRIFVKGSPEKGMPIAAAVEASSFKSGNPIMGKGFYRGDVDLVNFETGEGLLTPAYSYGAQIAELEVDEETCQVKLLRMTAAQDCGRAINPLAVEGQMDGCINMAQGMALTEELVWEDGIALTPSFTGYGLLTAVDTPHVERIIVEPIEPKGPFGAKEAGEATIISTLPAIVNAIYDATGVMIHDLPITPDKILRALDEKKQG